MVTAISLENERSFFVRVLDESSVERAKGKEHLRQSEQATKPSTNFNKKAEVFLSPYNQEDTQLPLKESPVLFQKLLV